MDRKLAKDETSDTREVVLLSPVAAARLLLVLLVAAGVYFFHGFFVPVLTALVIATASWPLYTRIVAGLGSTTAAASLAMVLVLGFIIVPVSLGISYSIDELRDLLKWGIETNRNGALAPVWIAELPFVGGWLEQAWSEHVGRPGALAELTALAGTSNAAALYRGALAFGGSAFSYFLAMLFMLFTLFFLFKDGEKLRVQVNRIGDRIFPKRWDRFAGLVPATIASTVTGMTLIAIGEGIVLGVAYWIAGAPSPVTLGVLTGIMAMIPGGAPLSFTLVSAYLVASGSWVAGAGLFAWGSVELFIVDKTLRPKLVGGPIKLPFLPTFFGLVGGVKTMGFLGLFIGPVLMALLVAVWREWQREADVGDGVEWPR